MPRGGAREGSGRPKKVRANVGASSDNINAVGPHRPGAGGLSGNENAAGPHRPGAGGLSGNENAPGSHRTGAGGLSGNENAAGPHRPGAGAPSGNENAAGPHQARNAGAKRMKDDAYAAETEEVLKHVALTGESPVVSSEALIRAYSNVRRRLKEAADIKACIVCDEIVDASDSILLEPATMTQDPPAPWLYHLGKTHRYRIDNADDPDVLIAAILGVTRGAAA
ncbi:hypothetical protein CYMTET_29109 [Cymbomonas tetramitiformis]|uniref:Uncharacterized protein n=1 Tax=Cymbomonas tetramitiformis TaxID=36881 RepID=A0AAE0FLR0_9CHLO|nr:hypothetical protein CYMTET_29109 [Cymbomonas tetramitiformis]